MNVDPLRSTAAEFQELLNVRELTSLGLVRQPYGRPYTHQKQDQVGYQKLAAFLYR